MTIPQVVDGVTDADAAFMNQLVDAANQANAAFNVLQESVEDLQTGALPIPLAGIEGALGEDKLDAGVVDARQYATLDLAVAALVEGMTLDIPAAEYVRNTTLVVAADNVRITCQPGGSLKAGPSPTGTMATHLRFVDLSGRTGVTIEGLTFDGPDAGYSGIGASAVEAAVLLADCVGCTVRDNTFNLAGHSSNANKAEAVTVAGTSATDNAILHNTITGAGIRYSYAGPSRTTCAFNTIIDAPGNALSGTGNGGTPVDNVVMGNHIVSPGRMGIEDWSGIYRTQIVNNTVIGPSAPTAEGMGISAAARETLVQGNTIRDFPIYAIEASGRGMRIIGNHLRQVDADALLQGVGIGVNSGNDDPLGGTMVLGNYVEGFAYGVAAVNEHGPVQIASNVFVNCQRGIYGDTNDDYSVLAIQGNICRFTVPNDDAANTSRDAIVVTSGDGSGNVGCRILGNTVVWETTAAAGSSSGNEFAIRVNTIDALVAFNTVDAHGITGSGSLAPIGISGNGSTVAGLKVIGNAFLGGALAYVNNYTTPVYTLNNKAPDAGTALETFFNTTPAGKQTGVAVSAAGIHAALVNLGLITA